MPIKRLFSTCNLTTLFGDIQILESLGESESSSCRKGSLLPPPFRPANASEVVARLRLRLAVGSSQIGVEGGVGMAGWLGSHCMSVNVAGPP